MKSKYGKYLVAESNGVVNANRVEVWPWDKWLAMERKDHQNQNCNQNRDIDIHLM